MKKLAILIILLIINNIDDNYHHACFGQSYPNEYYQFYNFSNFSSTPSSYFYQYPTKEALRAKYYINNNPNNYQNHNNYCQNLLTQFRRYKENYYRLQCWRYNNNNRYNDYNLQENCRIAINTMQRIEAYYHQYCRYIANDKINYYYYYHQIIIQNITY